MIGDDYFDLFSDIDCWIIDKLLEKLNDPEIFLKKIRKIINSNSCIVACIPNAQHWTIQAKICIGDLNYQNNDLANRVSLRGFSRGTIFQLFQQTGYKIIEGTPIIYNRLENQAVLSAMNQFAISLGADSNLCVEDSQAEFYIIKAIPI